jgi:hypothetical protein
MSAPRPHWRPGDGRADLHSMIRVDQAGEYGATRIYAGQLAVLGESHPAAHVIAHMAQQEKRHLDTFDQMMIERGVRPTVLHPFWTVAGYWLGAATALIGPGAAMACTAAVETEIDKHYSDQRRALATMSRTWLRPSRISSAKSWSIATPPSRMAPRSPSAILSFQRSSGPAAARPSRFPKDLTLCDLLLPPAPPFERGSARRAGSDVAAGRARRPDRADCGAQSSWVDGRSDSRSRRSQDQPADRLWRRPLPAEHRGHHHRLRPARRGRSLPRAGNLRNSDDPESNSWANKAIELSYVGRTGIQSCTPVGPGGVSGCFQQFASQYRAERGGGDIVNWNRLIEAGPAGTARLIDEKRPRKSGGRWKRNKRPRRPLRDQAQAGSSSGNASSLG